MATMVTSHIVAWCSVLAYMLLIATRCVTAVEFTFDLPDNEESCFYEEVKSNTSVYLEYQVSAGGQLDVDVVVLDPKNKEVYKYMRSTFDSNHFVSELSGVYSVCFGNKFSSLTHKLVYVDLQVGEEPALPGIDEHATVLTQMGSLSQTIHKSLNDILDAQTHHRLREAQGRKRAEELNETVMWYASLETVVLFLIGILQIVVLRTFFTDRKPSQSQYSRVGSGY